MLETLRGLRSKARPRSMMLVAAAILVAAGAIGWARETVWRNSTVSTRNSPSSEIKPASSNFPPVLVCPPGDGVLALHPDYTGSDEATTAIGALSDFLTAIYPKMSKEAFELVSTDPDENLATFAGIFDSRVGASAVVQRQGDIWRLVTLSVCNSLAAASR